MFRAYLDESEEGPIFAVGGFFGTDDQWNSIEPQWLSAPPRGVDYFHATDCFGGREQFRDLKLECRTELLETLTDLIVSNNLRLLCGGIHVPTYLRFAPRRLRNLFLGNKYVAAGEIAVELACQAIPPTAPVPELPSKNDGPNEICNFFFECNNYRSSMIEALNGLRCDNLLWWRNRVGTDAGGTKTGSSAIPLLQVGDLRAFLGAKKLTDAREGRISWKVYYSKLEKAGCILGIRWADERSIKLPAGLHEELKRNANEGKSYWDDI